MKSEFESAPSRPDSVVAALEEIHDQLMSGKHVDIEVYARRHPEHAEELRRLARTIQAVADFGDTVDGTSTGGEPHASINREIGEFRILREAGRGGMGIVYEAEQGTLGRRVALKILPFAALVDSRQLMRFQNEARAAASLHHDHIVPIHSVGSDKGVHYYAMQFIDGPSAAEIITSVREAAGAESQTDPSEPGSKRGEGSETQREIQAKISTQRSDSRTEYQRSVVEWTKQAASALAHAHENGVLHRDIKPGNLLVDGAGKLWITDFGLARLEKDASMTATGDLVGTLRYMPPEIVSGRGAYVDHRADIYSLGLTMFEMLTLVPAFDAADRESLLHRIISQEPPSPRGIDESIPRELELVFRKATEKDPRDRYASALQFAEDLGRVLNHHPIHARPPSLAQRTMKWSRRNPALVAGSVVALVFTLSVCSLVLWQASRRVNSAMAVVSEQNKELRETQTELSASLQLASNAVDEMYTNFADEWISQQANLTDVQRDFVIKAADVYEALAARSGDDLAIQKKAVKAYWNVAAMHGNMGELTEAADFLEKALDVVSRLVDVTAGQSLDEEAYAWSASLRAELALNAKTRHRPHLHLLDKADNAHRRLAALASVPTPSQPVLRYLAKAEHILARTVADDELDRSISYVKASIENAEKLVATFGESQDSLRILRDSLNWCRTLLDGDGKTVMAKRELEVARQLSDRWPRRENKWNLLAGLVNLAQRKRRLGDLEGARGLLEEAIPIGRMLTQQFPDIPKHGLALSGAHHVLFRVYQSLGEFDLAEEQIRHSIEAAKTAGSSGSFRVFERMIDLAEFKGQIGDKVSAIDILKELRAEAKQNRPARQKIANTQIQLARNCRGLSYAEIESMMRDALSTMHEVNPLGTAFHQFQWQRDKQKAEAAFRVYLEDARGALKNRSEDVGLLNSISGVQTKGPFKDLADFDEALQLIERAARLDSERPTIWLDYGWAYLRLARPGDAATMFEKTIESGYAERAPLAALGVAKLNIDQGNRDEARRWFEKGVDLLRPFGALNCEEVAVLEEVAEAIGDQATVANLLKDRWPGPATQ